jgi:prepilin-type N-terminal cleavage/methylation domain-containing protein
MKTDKCFFRGGYTLAEVLIVVVIIAIMATLAVPRFAQQKDKVATAEAIGIMTTIHRALLRAYDEDGNYPAAITSGKDADITTGLGIEYQAPTTGWTFTTDALGTVTASNTAHGTLIFFIDGLWNGTGDYNPTNGSLWPHLLFGNS